MAKSSAANTWRPLATLLAVVLALGLWSYLGPSQTPKLGLDLRGGTQVTLTPRVSDGTITDDQLKQAVDIIRQRVNGLGVAEAEVSTQGQGASASILVSVPGVSEQGIAEVLKQTAKLAFRPVEQLAAGTPNTPEPSSSASPSASASASPSASATPTANAEVILAPFESDANDAALQNAFANIDCTNPTVRQGGVPDDPTKWIVTCSKDGSAKYLLQPAFIEGTSIDNAAAGVPQGGTTWLVTLDFDSEGTQKLADASTLLYQQTSPKNQFAIVLDGLVSSSPYFSEPILGGQAQITGTFTQQEATDLANILKYGALPLTLEIAEVTSLSPTLGQDQLNAGLLAGALGLLLVVVYLLLYYRVLGMVAVLSLVVAAIMTYLAFIVLGAQLGFTLTLAGVAGAIVAVGITADSFVVYFERIRDEIREGKTLKAAINAGWARARRTILVADFVSLLAAAVLWWLSIGSVRGFAFTLGLTTVIDIAVAFMFTRPLVVLFGRNKWFSSGSPMTGLDPKRLGVTSVSAPHARSTFAESVGE